MTNTVEASSDKIQHIRSRMAETIYWQIMPASHEYSIYRKCVCMRNTAVSQKFFFFYIYIYQNHYSSITYNRSGHKISNNFLQDKPLAKCQWKCSQSLH